MPYEVEHFAKEGYISIVHRGIGNLEEYKSAHTFLAEALTVHQLKKLMVDVSAVPNEILVADHYLLLSDLPGNFPRGCRIAVVVNPEIQTEAQFVENVAQNRGLNLRSFSSSEEALQWLLSGLV